MSSNSLGDFFPQEDRESSAIRSIELGTVIRKTVSFPECDKIKFFVIIGICEDSISVASVFINTEVNENVNFSEYLKSLQYEITQIKYPFLTYNSFVDCSQIYVHNFEQLKEEITNSPEIICGLMEDGCFANIHYKCTQSKKINPYNKRKYGLTSTQ